MEETRTSTVHSFRVVSPGTHRYVQSTRRFLISVCRLAGVDEEDRDSLGLALTEILNNSIDHGQLGEEHPLETEIEIGPDKIRMVVTEGRPGTWDGPDMERVERDVQQPKPDETQFRGRGLLLVCSLMDEMNVRSASHGGTVVEVVKLR